MENFQKSKFVLRNLVFATHYTFLKSPWQSELKCAECSKPKCVFKVDPEFEKNIF